MNWTDEIGVWEYKQTAFAPPPHPTGLRVSPDATQTELVEGDPITTNVFLHGNTGAAAPVLPTVFNLLATWGPAEVTLNGQLFNNPFDGPAPRWFGHTMTTPGVRNPDGTVRTTSGDIYVGPNPNGTPLTPADGVTDWDDMEVHFTWHDAPTPMTGNIPPPFSFFYHLVFEDVAFEIGPELLHPGDCNADGKVDAADLACVVDVEQRDIVLTVLNTSPGDLDGNGDVSFADFLVLSVNFGKDLQGYADGNIDLKNGIEFADFLVLSTNFGNTPTDVAAVPEPSSLALMLLGLTVVGRHISTRRRTETSTRST